MKLRSFKKYDVSSFHVAEFSKSGLIPEKSGSLDNPGWNGRLQGFNVHYRYPTEELFLPGHSLYLSSKLVNISPLITLQLRTFSDADFDSSKCKREISWRTLYRMQ